MKDYLDKLIHLTTDNILEADSVEYAIMFGWVTLTYTLHWDISLILDRKAEIVDKFRRVAEENMAINSPLNELIGQLADFK
jgi:hypothetical protein